MTEQVAPFIGIPSSISPADADAFRVEALATLELSKDGPNGVVLEIDDTSLTPVAVQLLVATTRTAERLDVTLDISERCQGVLTDLQSQ